MANDGTFHITVVDWNWLQSNEIRPDLSPSAPIREGPLRATLVCDACEHVWEGEDHGAYGRGPGNFVANIDGTLSVVCPQCETTGKIPRSAYSDS